MTQPRLLRLFISYAHEDDLFRRKLETHLSSLKRQGLVEIWSDRAIEAGQEWEQSISQQLKTADIILLLISPDFLASNYIYEKELKRAMERHEADGARVIPVFLRPCDWKDEVFGKLQGVPDNATPISRWEDRDEAFQAVARAIRQAAGSLREPEERARHEAEQRAQQEAEAKYRAERRARQEQEERERHAAAQAKRTLKQKEPTNSRKAANGSSLSARLAGVAAFLITSIIIVSIFINLKQSSHPEMPTPGKPPTVENPEPTEGQRPDFTVKTLSQKSAQIKEIKKMIFRKQDSNGVSHFVGRAKNETFNLEGEAFLDILSVDDASGKVSAHFGWRKGLFAEGNLVGTIDVNYRLELAGIVSSVESGTLNCQLNANFTDYDTIKGAYTLVPQPGSLFAMTYGMITQIGEFVLTRK